MVRNCPYCSTPMILDPETQFLICSELCQHRTCKTCGEDIHRGGKHDSLYYDDLGKSVCWWNPETESGMEHMP